MKIFYGVQGTGNGHITRARVMAKEFQKYGFDVTYMFSGRPADKFFDMDIFGAYIVRPGLTFNIEQGKVNLLKTVKEAKIKQLVTDIHNLDLSEYDVVISDYEPITSWAGRLQGKEVVGIGHQYAFNTKIPKAGNNIITDAVMKNFAPADINIGLHWNHFGQRILPPIIETPSLPTYINANSIVVYLPFENQTEVGIVLSKFTDYQFLIYCPNPPIHSFDNIEFKPLSREGFQQDVYHCDGVICNAGFELASEALHLGKKLLVKPVDGQMEQISNALALNQLEYGKTMAKIDSAVIREWLTSFRGVRVEYPPVAAILAGHLHRRGHLRLHNAVYRVAWRHTNITR